MESTYSVETIELICANETDGNAQVTTPVEIEEATTEALPDEEEVEQPKQTKKRKKDKKKKEKRSNVGGRVVMNGNLSTNFLLFGILCLLFLFMIFKCD